MLLATCLIGPSAAHAQIGSSRSGSPGVDEMGDEEGMRALVAFGRCYARDNRRSALELLATSPSSREELLVYRRLFGRGAACIEPGMTLGAALPLTRGAIAEGLLRIPEPVPASHQRPAPAAAQVRNLSDAARCYTANNRDRVRELLTTRAGSRDETARVTALWPHFSACLPAGVSGRFGTTVIRFRLAEALLMLPPMTIAAPGSGQ